MSGSGASDPQVIEGIVALIVSLIAFIATLMQVMQQYYASAAGYAQCNKMVMGRWADSKKRRFSWEELRYEVEFEAPVIFVSFPKNDSGPIIDSPIYLLEGTPESLEDTWSELSIDQRKAYSKKSHREQIHTADNERASWTMLLSAVHRMEHDSREWQDQRYQDIGPPSKALENGLPMKPPGLQDSHTLTVALQRKRKSWDTMPSAVARPYATTTMCHLIEMAAALGIYWKEFDRKRDRYRAEGNGFMILGERVSDLGLMYSFQPVGKCRFERKRVIPVDEIKELCFGCVPTMYRETLDQRRLGLESHDDDVVQSLASLQMGTRAEIAETLVLIGCNNNAVRCFSDPSKQTSHLFPVSFEIIGMLSRTYHIRNSVFTYIPNPTPDRWDKRSVSLVKMMEAYEELVQTSLPGVSRNPAILAKINHHIKRILALYEFQKPADELFLLNALHDALDDCDEILTAKSRLDPKPDEKQTRQSLLANPETGRQERRREIVQDVLRSHLQEVLRLLNDREDSNTDNNSLSAGWIPTSPGTRVPDQARPPLQQPRFEDMHAASPDERQDRFMDVYFKVIRQRVVPLATTSTERRASLVGAPPGFRLRRGGTGRTQASITLDSDTGAIPPLPSLPDSIENSDVNGRTSLEARSSRDDDSGSLRDRDGSESVTRRPIAEGTAEGAAETSLIHLEVAHDDVWCTLIFRMVCWLMLHDFHKMDVQLPKSELLGNRMPVYVA